MMIVYVSSMHVPLGFRGSPQIKEAVPHTYTMYMHVNPQVHVRANIRMYMHMYLYTNSR